MPLSFYHLPAPPDKVVLRCPEINQINIAYSLMRCTTPSLACHFKKVTPHLLEVRLKREEHSCETGSSREKGHCLQAEPHEDRRSIGPLRTSTNVAKRSVVFRPIRTYKEKNRKEGKGEKEWGPTQRNANSTCVNHLIERRSFGAEGLTDYGNQSCMVCFGELAWSR